MLDALTYAGDAPPSTVLGGPDRRSSRATSPTPSWSTGSSPTPTSSCTSPPSRTTTTRSTTRGPFVHTNLIGTYHAARGRPPARRALPPHLHRRGLRRPRARRPGAVHRGHPLQPLEPLLLDQGRRATCSCAPGSAPSACAPRSPTAPTTTARASTSRSSSRARSPTSSTACGPSSTAPGSTCATGSTSTTTTTAVWTIIDQGGIGETYLIGADGEVNNRDVVAIILELMGQDRRRLRPRHRPRRATTCATPSTPPGCAPSSAGRPRYPSFRAGLAATIDWYRDNEAWWRPMKDATEAQVRRTAAGRDPLMARWLVTGAGGMLGHDLMRRARRPPATR